MKLNRKPRLRIRGVHMLYRKTNPSTRVCHQEPLSIPSLDSHIVLSETAFVPYDTQLSPIAQKSWKKKKRFFLIRYTLVFGEWTVLFSRVGKKRKKTKCATTKRWAQWTGKNTRPFPSVLRQLTFTRCHLVKSAHF